MDPGTEEDTPGKEGKCRAGSAVEATLGREAKGAPSDGAAAEEEKNWATAVSRGVRSWEVEAWPEDQRTAPRGERARPGIRGILPAVTGKDQGSERRQDCPTHASIALPGRESRPSSGTSFRVSCEGRSEKRAEYPATEGMEGLGSPAAPGTRWLPCPRRNPGTQRSIALRCRGVCSRDSVPLAHGCE
jgi:hypothetical protein